MMLYKTNCDIIIQAIELLFAHNSAALSSEILLAHCYQLLQAQRRMHVV